MSGACKVALVAENQDLRASGGATLRSRLVEHYENDIEATHYSCANTRKPLACRA